MSTTAPISRSDSLGLLMESVATIVHVSDGNVREAARHLLDDVKASIKVCREAGVPDYEIEGAILDVDTDYPVGQCVLVGLTDAAWWA